MMTVDETWLHHYNLRSKIYSMLGKTLFYAPPAKLQAQKPA